jgi:hypothetical protein
MFATVYKRPLKEGWGLLLFAFGFYFGLFGVGRFWKGKRITEGKRIAKGELLKGKEWLKRG